jgi:hypothetical protein
MFHQFYNIDPVNLKMHHKDFRQRKADIVFMTSLDVQVKHEKNTIFIERSSICVPIPIPGNPHRVNLQ